MLVVMIDVVLLNGTVGVGKTTTAEAVSDRLGRTGVVHGLIDLDAIRRLVPAPADDPFQHEVELANLRDLARNYRTAGATRLVLAGVVEDAAEVERYREATDAVGILLVRLVASPPVLDARLRRRHVPGPELDWHLRRAPALDRILQDADLEERVVDVTDLPPPEVATAVLVAAGWPH